MTRQAVLIACAVAGLGSTAASQTPTFKLTIFTSDAGYLGTSQVTSSPTGIDCRSESSGNVLNGGTCQAQFPADATVTLTATPVYGGTFDGWVGACEGQAATCQVHMTGDQTTSPKIIAKTYTLTIRGTGNSHGFVGSRDQFARPRLSCGIGPGGDTGGVCETQFPANQTVWLYREDEPLYARFAGYTGCGPTSSGDCMFVMDGPRTVTAGWIAMEVTIQPGLENGTGKVTGVATNNSVGKFDCTIARGQASGVCSAIWDDQMPPQSITLTATPTGNSVFLGWAGACFGTGACVIPFQVNPLRVWAAFYIQNYALSIAAAGSGSGRVTSVPTGVDCVITGGSASPNCSAPFATGTSVTLSADPTGGSTFGGWTGACSGSQPTCSLTITTATQATARFNPPRPVAELALALLGRLTISADEQRELDRFGNNDGTFNLGDLVALLARTDGRLSQSAMSALRGLQRSDAPRSTNRRPQ